LKINYKEMKNTYLLLFVMFVGCTSAYEINEAETARILKTLSADEMSGRKINTPGIDKAADFIANEFKTIGLSALKEAENYRQEFTVVSSSLGSAKVELNNIDMPATSYFMRLSAESITWTDSNMPEIRFVNGGDDFRASMGEAFQSDTDLLLVVASSHTSMFNMYRSYLSRPNLSFEKKSKDGPNVVVVLDDASAVNSIFVDASREYEDVSLANVVGRIEGKRANEIVLFSAHYDHIGIGEEYEGDSIYNGANDDASGTTAVIELARYFNTRGTPERTLVFAAFTAEEVGGYGSKHYSQQLNPDEIVAMLNIEMIGKTSKIGPNSAWMTGWEKSDLGEILQNNLKEVSFNFFADPYPDQNLFYRSDNATLARLGVPAHSISTTEIDIDEDYHQLSDGFETMNIENVTNTIEAIAVGSQGIVDGLLTPSRIDPEEVNN
jgi:peptidase M28-like protein